MKVSYNKFWQMCVEHDVKLVSFYSDKNSKFFVSKSTLNEMRKNNPVSLQIIDTLCSFFKCQPCDIMEFV